MIDSDKQNISLLFGEIDEMRKQWYYFLENTKNM